MKEASVRENQHLFSDHLVLGPRLQLARRFALARERHDGQITRGFAERPVHLDVDMCVAEAVSAYDKDALGTAVGPHDVPRSVRQLGEWVQLRFAILR